MTHDEMIAVIQHHKNGGKVQCRNHHSNTWHDFLDGIRPSWDFATCDYRAKPESPCHPLAARLMHALRPCVLHNNVKPDIKSAAKLIDDQHTAISKAFEAVLDNDMEACIKILGDASNEYPFLTDAEKRERETP